MGGAAGEVWGGRWLLRTLGQISAELVNCNLRAPWELGVCWIQVFSHTLCVPGFRADSIWWRRTAVEPRQGVQTTVICSSWEAAINMSAAELDFWFMWLLNESNKIGWREDRVSVLSSRPKQFLHQMYAYCIWNLFWVGGNKETAASQCTALAGAQAGWMAVSWALVYRHWATQSKELTRRGKLERQSWLWGCCEGAANLCT